MEGEDEEGEGAGARYGEGERELELRFFLPFGMGAGLVAGLLVIGEEVGVRVVGVGLGEVE